MFELLDSFVERIGEANVVQVVTDSASANVMACKNIKYLLLLLQLVSTLVKRLICSYFTLLIGRLLKAKRPQLIW